jgi:hypothetical protein
MPYPLSARAALKASGGRPPPGPVGRGRALGGPGCPGARSVRSVRSAPWSPATPSGAASAHGTAAYKHADRQRAGCQCLGALLGRLRTGHQVGIYIEWVLCREPHHLPRQPTRSISPGRPRPGLRCARDIHIYIQGTQPAWSLAPSWSRLWRAGPGARPVHCPVPRALEPSSPRARARLPANRTIPHSPRRPAPFPLSLIPSPPRRLPSVHLSLPTGECSGPTGTASQSPRAPPPSLGEAPPPRASVPTPRATTR